MAEAITEGCIQQLYAKGLRFETELKYPMALGDGRLRYPRLLREDWDSASITQLSGWVCASLAVAVLSGSNVRRLRRKESANSNGDSDSIANWLGQHLPRHTVSTLTASDFGRWGQDAHAALCSGGLALLRMQALSHARWALVVGMEWCSGAGPPMAHLPGLLLNDVGVSPVWGCAHNARLGLALLKPSLNGTSRQPLRTLDGGLLSVLPDRLVLVVPDVQAHPTPDRNRSNG